MNEEVPSELLALMEGARAAIDTAEPDAHAVHASLTALLEFLATPENRTDQNCQTVGAYFLAQDEWAHNADDLPAAYARIVWDIEGQLPDTVSDPDTASEFESTPEQLLERLSALGIE